MNILEKTFLALAILAATTVRAWATMPPLGEKPSVRTDAACWAWADEQAKDEDIAEMWGVLDTDESDHAVAVRRLFDECLGRPRPEIVGFRSSTEFDIEYCSRHSSQKICKNAGDVPAPETYTQTLLALTCSGSDTLALLQRIIDDGIKEEMIGAPSPYRRGAARQNWRSSLEHAIDCFTGPRHLSGSPKQSNDNRDRFRYNWPVVSARLRQDAQRQLAELEAEDARLQRQGPYTSTPQDVITTDQTDRKATCKATLVAHGAVRTVYRRLSSTRWSRQTTGDCP